MKQYSIIFYLPSTEDRDTPYTGEKSAARHANFISYFPENVSFYLAVHSSEYLGDDTFIPKFKRLGNSWIQNQDTSVYADLILGMTRRIDCKNKYINPIRDICIDKTQIEQIFPHLTFSSILCQDYRDIVNNFDTIKSDIKVLKPLEGSRAVGIHMCAAVPNQDTLDGTYPYIIQEFIDTSGGFYGVGGIHDFRTIILNGEVTGCFLRVAPEGVMTANVSTGASIIDYEVSDIPREVLSVIQEIDAYFSEIFPDRYYSIDIGVGTNGEIKVFELNASPALSTQSIRAGLARHIIKNILKI